MPREENGGDRIRSNLDTRRTAEMSLYETQDRLPRANLGRFWTCARFHTLWLPFQTVCGHPWVVS